MITQTASLQGSFVALVTPMHSDGSLDFDSLAKLVEFHIDHHTDVIVAVGTTGESATLSIDEHLQVVERIVAASDGRIPVVAGTGANSTSEAIQLTREAKHIGVDACLLVVPYYNKPTQQGLYQHFMKIADSVDVAQILYNVPGRTITDLSNDVALQLASHSNIIGIKDATGDIERGKDLIAQAPQDFAVYSGDDLTAHQLMSLGAKGNISVTANVVPDLMAKLCRAAMAGDVKATESLQQTLMPLHEALFAESNPIPVKWAVELMGLAPEGIRLPLTPLSGCHREPLRQVLASLSLLA